jgi:DNA-binding NtrC family response regulator
MFLDEIGEMPLAMQAKLLRVLEDRQARRVGGIENYPIDLRFIAATNRDLAAAVGRGTFRSDLYYRLNGITLQIPPLRERPDEIEPLAMAVAARAMARLGFPGRPLIAPQVLELLRRYHWPGNVRELKNELERAIVLARGGRIEREHLPLEKLTSSYLVKDSFAGPRPPVMPLDTDLQRVVTLAKEPPKQPGRPLEAELREMERRRIVEVLEACDGNQTRAAERLGVSRKVLMTRLDEYGIPRPRKRR